MQEGVGAEVGAGVGAGVGALVDNNNRALTRWAGGQGRHW